MARKKAIDAEEVKAALTPCRAVKAPDYAGGLSTGSTLLDLACTGRVGCGYVPGSYYFIVGDSDSGKSVVTLSSMAEASISPRYDAYRLIHDNAERGVQMDLVRHFGERMASRLCPPCWKGDLPWYSETVEDFYLNLDAALREGPCIYVMDSMDGLSSQSEEKQFVQMKGDAKKAKKAEESGGESPEMRGSYGDGKAKKNSALIRQMIPDLDATNSILIVVSQTRDDLRSPFGGKTHSGGNAISFYAQVRIWSKVVKKLTKAVRDKERHVGNLCEFHVKRSRFTGREARVRVPIYFSAGIDDVGSCIDYLVEESHWAKDGVKIDATELGQCCTREKLIERIEGESREAELRQVVGAVWAQVESEMAVKRKSRYGQ